MLDPGKEKLGIQEENRKVFDKSDGTEIDDDECLLAYDKGTVFILSNAWKPDTVAPHIHPETEPEVEKYTYVESEIDLAITKEAATCISEKQSRWSRCQMETFLIYKKKSKVVRGIQQ